MKQAGIKDYTLNQAELARKATEKFDKDPPYTPREGDWKGGKPRSLTLICNGVYHEVFKRALLDDLTKGWTKTLSKGELLVDGVDPRRDRNGVLDTTKIYLKWRDGSLVKKTTVHIYHTTRNIRLQGINAMEIWDTVVKQMFDRIVEKDDTAKKMKKMVALATMT